MTNRYSLLKGFAAKLTEQQLTSFQSLQGDVIDHIEPDGVSHSLQVTRVVSVRMSLTGSLGCDHPMITHQGDHLD